LLAFTNYPMSRRPGSAAAERSQIIPRHQTESVGCRTVLSTAAHHRATPRPRFAATLSRPAPNCRCLGPEPRTAMGLTFPFGGPCACGTPMLPTYSSGRVIRAWGTVMRINRMIVSQAIIATCAGIAVMYLQRRVAGPVGGIIPGILGFVIGWLVTAAIPDDIESLRRWRLRRRASAELQPK
jgi:hypothetical protein